MPIEVLRIDDRLVHGQVIEGWLKNITISQIIVASDKLAKDKMQQVLLSMAIPKCTELKILNVNDAVKYLLEHNTTENKILVLVSDPKDALSLLEGGVDVKSINVGGMHFTAGKRQLLKNMSVDDDDIMNLNKIMGMGIELESRILPFDDRKNIAPVVEEEMRQIIKKG